MDRVEESLRPFRTQLLQVLMGIVLIGIGALCWARNTQIPQRLFCGLIVHVYGVSVIVQAARVCTRIRHCSKPAEEIRGKLDSVSSGYLRAGVIIGFVW